MGAGADVDANAGADVPADAYANADSDADVYRCRYIRDISTTSIISLLLLSLTQGWETPT